jgi:hypothetical protein
MSIASCLKAGVSSLRLSDVPSSAGRQVETERLHRAVGQTVDGGNSGGMSGRQPVVELSIRLHQDALRRVHEAGPHPECRCEQVRFVAAVLGNRAANDRERAIDAALDDRTFVVRVPHGVALAVDQHRHLLERLLQAAEEGERTGCTIEILVLQLLAHQMRRDITAALVPLERALTLAEPESDVRIFADEGPRMAALLEAAAKRRTATGYARRLLRASGMAEIRTPLKQDLIEPLSERELDHRCMYMIRRRHLRLHGGRQSAAG